MAFGKNPHVPKAQAAEQKAADAADDASRVRAWREAAHLWDRAAEREMPGKRRVEYEGHASRTPGLADDDGAANAAESGLAAVDPKLMN